MHNVGVLSGLAIAALALGACVGDTPTTQQGVLDGPCYTDGTCNPGLKCTVVGGSAKCVVSSDASVNDAAVTTDSAVDSGPLSCKFSPTPYPCGDPQPPSTCFGLAASCTLTGCNSTDIRWECNSPNQCTGTPCCLPAASALLVGSPNCTQGTLQLASPDAGGIVGTSCKQGLACPPGETQLCQSNSQCPTGTICSPVKVTGGPGSMNGYTVGACIK